MSKPNRKRSQRLRSTMDHIGRVGDESKRQAVKADDVLSTLEDREARRATRQRVDDPRSRVTGY